MKRFLSPKEFALAVGASESSLKRWADDGLIKVHRTAGGHRRIALREAIRYIRQAGLPVLKPEILGLGELAAMPKNTGEGGAAAALVEAIKEGRAEMARGLIMSHYLGGGSVAGLCDGPMASAMHAVGELWRHGPEGIFIEHRALDVCVQAMNHLRGLLPPPEEDAPLALGGAVEADPYELPTLMVATLLASAGWRVVNLGPNLPMEALLLAVKRHRPRLVWLSCSVTDAAAEKRSEIRKAAAAVTSQGRKLIAGGRGWKGIRFEPEDGLTLVGSMGEVAAYAEGMQGASA